MSPKKQKAKYFCENCGAEVSSNARFCPKCGKFFSSVRCPKCGFTGDVKTFINGCPQCGYAMPAATFLPQNEKNDKKKRLSWKSQKKITNAFETYHDKNGASSQTSEDAPQWVLVLSLCILAFMLFLFFFKCHY